MDFGRITYSLLGALRTDVDLEIWLLKERLLEWAYRGNGSLDPSPRGGAGAPEAIGLARETARRP